MFDLAVVNVAFPDILTEFGVSRVDGSWIVTIYNIVFGALLVVAGKSADSFGRRRLFRLGLAAFAIGAATAALAPGLGVMLAGRTVQGFGAAVMSPAAVGLLVSSFPLHRRTQVMAWWASVGALGITSGPTLGALVIEVTNWRAAFWLSLPICVGLLAASGRVLTESPRTESERRPDYLGAATVTAALAALALGISRSDVWGWTSPATLGAVLGGVALVGVFLARQRTHPEPILDLSLFGSRSFTVASLSGLVFFGGYGAYNLNNVLFLREAWGYSVLAAGLTAAVGPVTVTLLSPFAGRLANRFGFRLPAVIGAAVVAGGLFGLGTLLDEEPNPALFMAFVVILAVGIASFMPTNAAASVAELPPTRLSIGGAVANALRQVGTVLGVALLVAILGSPSTTSELVAAHSRGYLMVAAVMVATAVISTGQTGRPQRSSDG